MMLKGFANPNVTTKEKMLGKVGCVGRKFERKTI